MMNQGAYSICLVLASVATVGAHDEQPQRGRGAGPAGRGGQ